MIATFVLLIVTATFRPAKPTVGDVVTVDFARPVVIDPSPDYEVVGRQGTRLRIRTFQPRPIVLSGIAQGERFHLEIPVRSVLAPRDSMKPAPLQPPRAMPQARGPLIAIAVAALAAAAAWWTALFLDRRRAAVRMSVVLSPVERFRAQVIALRTRPVRQRWAALADATRAYLASRGFGPDLTTEQLLDRLREERGADVPLHLASEAAESGVSVERPPAVASVGGTIAEVLHQGDLEKFSPWGAPSADFGDLAGRALALPDALEPPAPPAEAAA